MWKRAKAKSFFEGITKLNQKEFESEIVKYFDLERDYESYRDKLSIVDDNLKVATEFGKGLRLLNQDLFETIISYITSANNNIPRIKGIIHKMCEKYGEELEDGRHAFPTIEELSKAEVEDLRALGLGFRDKYIYKTTKYIKENPTFF